LFAYVFCTRLSLFETFGVDPLTTPAGFGNIASIYIALCFLKCPPTLSHAMKEFSRQLLYCVVALGDIHLADEKHWMVFAFAIVIFSGWYGIFLERGCGRKA